MTRAALLSLLVLSSLAGCEDGRAGGDAAAPPLATDPRCASLCESDDPLCSADVATCQQECAARIGGFEGLCATCLLEDVQAAGCSISIGGEDPPCCPDPSYGRPVADCADLCAGQTGQPPTANDPRCLAICGSDDARCSSEVSACMAGCQARIEGVGSLCASCLLEEVRMPGCSISIGGEDPPCCPDPSYGRSVLDCTTVCQ